MKRESQEKSYNTHLASEFLVMSNVHRLGLEAYLTIGNMKRMDILVKGNNKKTVAIEVKGVAKKDDYFVGKSVHPREDLFYVLICYNGKIQKVTETPEIWVVPSKEIANNYTSHKSQTNYLRSKFVREHWQRFKDAWNLIENYVTNKN